MTHLPVAKSVARWILVSLWAGLLVPGCATTAPMTAWRPAEINVEGMRRLSVIDFSGDNGAAVSAALTARLWENQFYSLVDQSDLTPVRVVSATHPQHGGVTPADYLDSARDREVDGIIVGDIIEYRCDDHVLTNTDIHLGTGRAENHRRGTERKGLDVDLSHNETVHREATVSIAFRLVEVDTGNVRATRKTTHNFQGDFDAGSSGIPAKGEVLDELTARCVNEFVSMLAPQETELRLTLARSHLFQRGQTLVCKGNDFARRGRWEEARASWQQVLEVNPSNDSALYNLAIAHAAHQEFTQAEELAIQALNLKHRDLYADGLQQIRKLAADHEQTLRQRQRVNLSTVEGRRQLFTANR